MWYKFVDYLFYDFFRFSSDSILGKILSFLVYDFFKIIFMVFTIMLLISYIRTYISANKLNQLMNKKMYGLNYLAATLFGALTPFCSCSGIPIFIGFIKAGVPLGVSISFLVTSPLVNEVAVIMLANYYGWKVALAYALSGIILGIVSGLTISLFNLEKEILIRDQKKLNKFGCITEKEFKYKDQQQRLGMAFLETRGLITYIYKFIFLGVLLGGLIHNYIPKEVLLSYVGGTSIWTVPLAVIIGVPIYAGCSTVAPVIFSITSQGIPLGTSLALLMSIAGLSLPEAMILKSTMSHKLLALFFTIVTIGIIAVGYLFNLLFA